MLGCILAPATKLETRETHLPGLGIPLAVTYFMIRREQCGVVKALSGSPGPVHRKTATYLEHLHIRGVLCVDQIAVHFPQ